MLTIPFIAINCHSYSNGDNLKDFKESKNIQCCNANKNVDCCDEFKIFDKSTSEVVCVNQKEFIYNTVAMEMSPSFCDEALKAQAVASYTYFCNQKENSNDNFDFSVDKILDENYFKERFSNNFDEYYGKIQKNVDQVFGEVIKSDGNIILSTYYAISSGVTQASVDVFGGERKYLVPVESPGDLYAPNYETSVDFNKDDFYSTVKQKWPDIKLSESPNEWVNDVEKNSSGMVKSVKIGDIYTDGKELRNIFSLRSACFNLNYNDNTFTFTVFGYGHGVGMSQYGAEYMAKQGSNYKDILSWYYPETKIEHI